MAATGPAVNRRIEVAVKCKSQHIANVVFIPPQPAPLGEVIGSFLTAYQQHLGGVLRPDQEQEIRQQAQLEHQRCERTYTEGVRLKAARSEGDGQIIRHVEIHSGCKYTDDQLRMVATLDAVLTMNYYCPNLMSMDKDTVLHAVSDKIYRHKPDPKGDHYVLAGDRLRFIAGDVMLGEMEGDEIQAEYKIDNVDKKSGICRVIGSFEGDLSDEELELDPEMEDDQAFPFGMLVLWFKHGQLERTNDLPALRDHQSVMWFTKNKCHRETEPAIVYYDGDTIYCRNGMECSAPIDIEVQVSQIH